MKRISILSAAAILVAAVVAPSVTQAACALHDTGCTTYPMPKKEEATKVRAEIGSQQTVVRSAAPTARVERRETVREARIATNPGGPVRAAGVATVGATAPIRAANSYAYYNEGYNGWDRRSYGERNGFVCTPGELFKGFDGRLHVCQ